MTLPRHLALALALAAGVTFVGCRVVSSSSTTTQSGQYVSHETLEQIKPGAKEDYVLALLGEPSTRKELEGGTAIWRWHYRESRSSSGGVLLLFRGQKETSLDRSTFVQFEDGVVTKVWRD